MNLAKVLEKIVARLKNQPDYSFNIDFTTRQLLEIIYYRGMQAVRGMLAKVKLGESSGLIFCGRNVVIEHGHQIRVGPNFIVEDGVHINALSRNGLVFGRNVTICKSAIIVGSGVIANKGEGLVMGDFSAIGAQSFIGCQGGIKIGSYVIMGPSVRIFSENHNVDSTTVPIRLQGENRKGVTIEDDCWIGANCTILDGVTIGSGSVIAAGSVVNKDVPPFSIAAGVPFRVLRSRI